MRMSDLSKKLVHADRAYAFYPENKKTLVGFSGGADSVVLMHALIGFLGNDRVCAVHINHMLRGADADADEAFCRRICADYGVPIEVLRTDVAALAKNRPVDEVIALLEGIQCRFGTSCPDQLARALEEYKSNK